MALHDLKLTYKERFLTPEQFNQLLKLLQNKPFIRPSIVYELKDDALLKEKFDVSTGELISANDRKVLGKILKSIRQDYNGHSVPAFKYDLGKNRYSPIYNPEKYSIESGIKFLHTAYTILKYHPEVKREIEKLINRLLKETL